ncbi:MAG: hypothetical protein ACRDRA_12150, partial [Pseudonocardiaceae bacterium]
MDPDAIARRFPLISRSRPPGRCLDTRLTELREIMRESGTADDHTRMTRAGEVCNKAALIASDCGATDLARNLCWRQHDVFDAARPLPAQAAKLALQPVLNIPRQLIREGDGATAYQMLDRLYRAARDRTDAELPGRRISLRDVTCAPDDHRTVCTLLWAALLADGARALALAGRWQDAAKHAAAHRGVGTRLLDGRQVTILSLADRGEHDRAAAMVEDSVLTQPWEQTVASLLLVYCRRGAGDDIEQDAAAMLDHALWLVEQAEPSTAVFRTRVGLTALDLTDRCDCAQVPRLRAALIAAASADAYAAREALAHPVLRPTMTTVQEQAMVALVEASGLGRGAIPQELLDNLMTSLALAENQLRALLDRPRSP